MTKKYQAIGNLIFTMTNEGIECFTECKPHYLTDEEWIKREKEYHQYTIYQLMSGEEYLSQVRCGGFIDYDGAISEIFVDSYVSNLGLNECGICQGKFLVNGDIFEELCKIHKIEVNWANK